VTDALVAYAEVNARFNDITILLAEINRIIETNRFKKFKYDLDYIGALERNLEELKEKFNEFTKKTKEVVKFLKSIIR